MAKMKNVYYRNIKGQSLGYWGLLGALAVLIVAGVSSSYYMEHHGHIVTGMTNQVVWGLPHVFAIFLIVAASGALNVASIGTVFDKYPYKPVGRFSALLAMALLIGGLMVLVLDLGRPDRLIVAMTKYNFKSIFAWNIFLYTGFLAIVGFYLWAMMDRMVGKFYKPAGVVAFVWRLILTTGTGSIFGFLVARDAYDAAIMAPLFIIMSFAFGLAAFLLLILGIYGATGREISDTVLRRWKNLLGVFVAAVFLLVVIYHLYKLYVTRYHGVEGFILLDGGVYTNLFWIGQILIGTLLPLFIIFTKLSKSRFWIAIAASAVILGGIAQLYVIIIGGQVYPMALFPGMEASSTFGDGVVAHYAPSVPEFFLGMSGVAITLLAVLFVVKILDILPESLGDAVVDPHASS